MMHSIYHVQIQKVQMGSNFDGVFLGDILVDEGREDPSTTLSRKSSARRQKAILMAFCWHADGGPTLNAGSVAL